MSLGGEIEHRHSEKADELSFRFEPCIVAGLFV